MCACTSETVWRTAEKNHVPAVAFVNKLDRDGAELKRVLKTMEDRLAVVPLPLQVSEASFYWNAGMHNSWHAQTPLQRNYKTCCCGFILSIIMHSKAGGMPCC